jgi:glutathione S-transferase
LTGIPYEAINYNSFGKTKGLERAPKTLRKLMPIIEDPNNHENPYQCDSTPILLYLNDKYLQSSMPLFPSSSEQRQSVIDMCLRLDSGLGLYARRLTYVQLLKEKTSAITIVLGEQFPWAYNHDDIRSRLISPFVACFMIARFRLHRIRDEHIREKTERILSDIGNHLCTNDYLVGQQFSAADLTFCSLIKLLTNVPFFSDNP